MQNFLRLVRLLKPYRVQVAIAGVLTLVTLVGDLTTPAALSWVVDRGLGAGRMDLVVLYTLLLIALGGMRSLAAFLQGYFQNKAGQGVVRDLRRQLYVRLQDLPLSFYRSMPTGQIMSRLTSDVEAVQEFVAWGVLFLAAGAVLSVAAVAVAA